MAVRWWRSFAENAQVVCVGVSRTSTWTSARVSRRSSATHIRATNDAQDFVGHHVNMYRRPFNLRPSIHHPKRRPG